MKKLLALVLALVMILGLATVGTSAAYSDAASIQHDEAVEVLSALKILEGKGNNTFDPTGDVKRSEMAKMVTLALLGDTDVSAFAGAASPLKDINGHWAEGYIKFCVAQGIIAGRGDGTFAPDDQVTATEAAKMLLVAIGYNAKVQGYEGTDQWKINVGRDAQLKRFYTDLSNLGADKALTRDEAAQLVYNAMDATLIEKTSQIDRVTGNVSDTYADYDDERDLLGETYKAYTFEGTFDQFSYTSKDSTWTYKFTGTVKNLEPGKTRWTAGNTVNEGTQASFDATTDYTELYKQNVKVLYVLDSRNRVDKALGVYPTDEDEVIATSVLGLIDVPKATDKEVKVDGKIYSLSNTAATTDIYEFSYDTIASAGMTLNNVKGATAAQYVYGLEADTARRAMYTFKLIDNDNDGKGDLIVTYPVAIAKVTAVNRNTVTLEYKQQTADAVKTSLRIADSNIYDGVAKDDFVLYTPDQYTSTKVDALSKLTLNKAATVSATKKTEGKTQVDGTWLDATFVASPKAGDSINYVAYNGFLVFQEGASGADLGSYVIIKSAATQMDNKVDNTLSARIIDGNGKTSVVEVEKVNGADVAVGALPFGQLFMAKINSDGNYELWDVNANYVYDNTQDATGDIFQTGLDGLVFSGDGIKVYANSTDAAATYTKADNGVAGRLTVGGAKYTIDDDAAVFIYYTSDDTVKVLTGKSLAANTKTATYNVKFVGYDESDSGFNTVKVIYLTADQKLASKSTYAFSLADPVVTKSGDKYIATVKVWNGTEVVELKTKAVARNAEPIATLQTLGAKAAFRYTLDANGDIDTVNLAGGVVGGGNKTYLAVTSVPGSNNMIEVGTYVWSRDAIGTPTRSANVGVYTYDITDDTTIFYIDLAGSEPDGSTSGSIAKAATWQDDNGDTAYIANVEILADETDGGVAGLIVYELNGDMAEFR